MISCVLLGTRALFLCPGRDWLSGIRLQPGSAPRTTPRGAIQLCGPAIGILWSPTSSGRLLFVLETEVHAWGRVPGIGEIFFKPVRLGRAVAVTMSCLFTVPTKLPCCPSLAWYNLGLLIHFAVCQWVIYIFCQGEIYVGVISAIFFKTKQNKTCLSDPGWKYRCISQF